MQLAIVVGAITATVKDASLAGRKLSLVRVVDAEGNPSSVLEVALDVTSAGVGERVLVVRGSAARQPAANRALAADLSIVGIVDDVHLSVPEPVKTSQRTRKVSHG